MPSATSDGGPTGPETDEQNRQLDLMRVAAASGMSVLIGSFAALITSNLGIAIVVFFAVIAGCTPYLYRKSSWLEIIGSGLYLITLLLVLAPVVLFAGGTPESLESLGITVDRYLDFVSWGFVFLVVALIIGVIGYLLKARAAKRKRSEGVGPI